MNKLWSQIGENLTFVLVCAAIVAGLGLAAHLGEKLLPE